MGPGIGPGSRAGALASAVGPWPVGWDPGQWDPGHEDLQRSFSINGTLVSTEVACHPRNDGEQEVQPVAAGGSVGAFVGTYVNYNIKSLCIKGINRVNSPQNIRNQNSQ